MRKLMLLVAALCVVAAAPSDTAAKLRAWRTGHEAAIMRELFDLLAIPNVATNKADINRNAETLATWLRQRHFAAEVVPTSGSPMVLGERRAPNATRTVTLYFHYDGQPVDPREWIYSPPFTPVIVTAPKEQGGTVLTLDQAQGKFEPEWRVYGRSASDDKSPIVALLAAVDGLDASGIAFTSNVRLILEGDEEAGSPSLEAAVMASADRVRGDALVMVDGPRHASGRATLFFGARGIMSATITVYGANHDLHSGNYGNWAPDPALQLANLLTSMKDASGRVTIAGFYDDVTPLTAEEKRAVDGIPNVEPTLMKAFGFSKPDMADERLELKHNLPTLTINGLESGTVGGQGRTIVPATASARLDLRLVKAIEPAKQFDRLLAHIRKQGYVIVGGEPDAATRAAHPLLARVVKSGGYPAGRTSMEVPIARTFSAALAGAAGGSIVRLPTIGGSAPFYIFSDRLKAPTFGLSVVNFDNNQHGANENVRIQNFWDAIESIGAILAM